MLLQHVLLWELEPWRSCGCWGLTQTRWTQGGCVHSEHRVLDGCEEAQARTAAAVGSTQGGCRERLRFKAPDWQKVFKRAHGH